MVINLRRHRRLRADVHGHTWETGMLRRDRKAMHRYRVWLNGVDVTNRTFYVDSRRGIVGMYRQRDGHFFVENGAPATEERRGHVRLGRRKVAA